MLLFMCEVYHILVKNATYVAIHGVICYMSIQSLNDLIVDNIVRLRQDSGLSQESIAARLQTMGINYTRGRLSMIETKKRPPTALLLVGLKIIFACNYDDFYSAAEKQLAESYYKH